MFRERSPFPSSRNNRDDDNRDDFRSISSLAVEPRDAAATPERFIEGVLALRGKQKRNMEKTA